MIGKLRVLFQRYAREAFGPKADFGDEDADGYVAKGFDAGHGSVDMGVAQWRVVYDTVSIRRTFIVRHVPGWLLSLRARAGDLFVHIVSPRPARRGIGGVARWAAAAVSICEYEQICNRNLASLLYRSEWAHKPTTTSTTPSTAWSSKWAEAVRGRSSMTMIV